MPMVNSKYMILPTRSHQLTYHSLVNNIADNCNNAVGTRLLDQWATHDNVTDSSTADL